ncbi:MAG TPA: dethiobiotin synthase [Gammaproteobacteria bacterium]|jgi:dethiobiotin synthetase|nr:dethiobiotin synthase [Gammaproteobacteria bacterium]
MSFKLFITGTDTNIGKTYISIQLLKAFTALGYTTLGIKPIASGCILKNNQLYNDDALALQQASSLQLPYEKINPFAFLPPIAPHIAAAKINLSLNVKTITQKLTETLQHPVDFQLIEGVGGWQVPLNAQETMVDLVKHYHWPVLLVVGLRLGCLNHALLTVQAIQQTNLPFIGWIANVVDPNTAEINPLIQTLETWIDAPYLGKVDHNHFLSAVNEIVSQLSR